MSLYISVIRIVSNEVKWISEKFKKYCLDCFTDSFVNENNQPKKNFVNSNIFKFTGITNTNLAITMSLLLVLLVTSIILVCRIRVYKAKNKKKSSNRSFIHKRIEQDIEQLLDRLNQVKMDSHLSFELCYLVERILKKTNEYTKDLNNQKQKFINSRMKKKLIIDSNSPNTITSSAIESKTSDRPKRLEKFEKQLNSTPISSDLNNKISNSHTTSYDTKLLYKDEDLVSLESSNASSSPINTSDDSWKSNESSNTVILNSKKKSSTLNNFDTIIEKGSVSYDPIPNPLSKSSNKSIRYYIPEDSPFARSIKKSGTRKSKFSYTIFFKIRNIKIEDKVDDKKYSSDQNDSFEIEFRDEPKVLKSSLKKSKYKQNDDDNKIESLDSVYGNENTSSNQNELNFDEFKQTSNETNEIENDDKEENDDEEEDNDEKEDNELGETEL